MTPDMSITCGCGEVFEDGDAFGRHLERPEGPCWDAARVRVSQELRAFKGNRTNHGFAQDYIMGLIKAAYEYGVTVGERSGGWREGA